MHRYLPTSLHTQQRAEVSAESDISPLASRTTPHSGPVLTDELLGVKPLKDGTSPKTARLLKRLKKVEALPAADRRAVLKLVDALLETRRRAGSR